MSDIQMELAKEEALSELRQIAVEAVTIFHSSQRIQKGIGVYPIAKKLRSRVSRLEDVKLKIKKEHQGEYVTANATGKIQWRAEYILLAVTKIIELLELENNHDSQYISVSQQLAEQIKYFKTQHPIHLV